MTEPTPPPRRPLATFLRASTDAPPAVDPPPVAAPDDTVPDDHAGEEARDTGRADADLPHDRTAVGNDDAAVVADDDEAFRRLASRNAAPLSATSAPSFMRTPQAAAPAPRWQWGLVTGLVVLLSLQIALADRARLAADAGSRPWISGLCSVLRCSLPAWREPAAFSMISRDVRPVPGQPGALQVQASFRNDARWAQAWPSLRLSLSDADGRVIGTRVFAPHDYLDPTADAASVLEPGQSAQIAFRVREPAASTVAFTFEFL